MLQESDDQTNKPPGLCNGAGRSCHAELQLLHPTVLDRGPTSVGASAPMCQ